MGLNRGDVLVVTLEAAMGADLTADPNTWTWTDLSSRTKGVATIVRGRADEAQQTQPASLTIRLGNTDGALTPRHPSSPWYLLWAVGTPVRLKVTIPGDATYTRMQGRVSAIKPVWPSGNSDVAFVDVTAKGALYNLQQGSPQLRSALYRSITSSSPVAYWPMDDGAAATQLASGFLGGTSLPIQVTDPLGQVGAVPRLGSGTLASWLPPAVDISNGSHLFASFPPLGTTSWAIDHVINMGTNRGTNMSPWPVMYIDGAGPFPRIDWDIEVQPAGLIPNDNINLLMFVVQANRSSVSTVLTQRAHAIFDGQPHLVRLAVTQSGPNINWTLFIDSDQVSGTVNAQTLQPAASVEFNPQFQVPPGPWAVGQLALWNTATPALSATTVAQATVGYAGETATARLTRLCAEQGVPIAITGTSTTSMGPQGVDTLYNLLRQCEDADVGILTDGLTAGLTYFARSTRYNQSVALALDANRTQIKWPPFDPLEDDQRLRTKFSVSRINGSSATFTDPSAKTRGEYPGQANLSLANDSTLTAQASWRTHLSTVPEMRTPSIAIDVRNSPELLSPYLATDIGKRYTAANPPVQYPPGGLDLVLEQYVEVIDGITWRTQLTGSPYAPWRAFVVNTDRVDGDGYTLAPGVNETATTLSVASTTGLLWGVTGDPASTFPFDIEVAGIRLRVTGVSGTASPQTFTVQRSMDGFDKSLPVNSPVRLWRPPVIAL